jgi:dolichol-phosphate mannosyltransferase
MANKKISIISPVYNEEENINIFFEAIQNVKNNLTNYDVELIFTNNASTDGTLKKLETISKKNQWVKIITLKRNFGYQNSLLCGLNYASGDLITMIDPDLEDPPEMINEFIKYCEMGHDVTYGIRKDREENYIMKKLRHIWYLLINKIADQDFIIDMAEFCMITKETRDSIISNKSTHIFLRNEIAYGGFKKKGIVYKRKARLYGKSKASLIYVAQYAIAGILTASTFPLRLISYLFLVLAPLNLIIIFNFSSLHNFIFVIDFIFLF